MNALEIRGLTKRRGDFALQGLDLTLPAGCIMGLIGENGAGKSTTIRLILNALSRDGGTVAVYGKDNRALTPLEREDIGAVLDEVGLPEYMTARQIGCMMAGIFTRWQPEVYRGYLRRLALPEDKPFRDFSRGMKMKLGLAAALSHQPKLLLLDEATSGLDPVVPGRDTDHLRGLHPGRGARRADLQPHRQRSGEDLRLHCVPAQGAAAAVRGKGSADGGVRHPAGRYGRYRSGGGVRTARHALWHGVSGAAQRRARRYGAGTGEHRGSVRVHGKGGVR